MCMRVSVALEAPDVGAGGRRRRRTSEAAQQAASGAAGSLTRRFAGNLPGPGVTCVLPLRFPGP